MFFHALKKEFVMTPDYNRQAKIIAKECNLPLNKALEVVAKLNGFKNWHEAQKHKPQTKIELAKEFLDNYDYGNDVSCSDPREGKGKNYQVKVKAIAEVRTYFKQEAKNVEEAVTKVREKLNSLDLMETDWEVTYIQDSEYPVKITDAFNGLGDGLYDDHKGVEKEKVYWGI